MYTIYYKPECPYSRKALAYLESKQMLHVRHNVHDFGGKEAVVIELKNNNFLPKKYNLATSTVPLIFKDGTFIGGCDQLLKR